MESFLISNYREKTYDTREENSRENIDVANNRRRYLNSHICVLSVKAFDEWKRAS